MSRAKWGLGRFDHSAIYVLIAATYTPFVTQMKDSIFAIALLTGVWGVAIVGIGIKLVLPGRFDRLAGRLYLAMAWTRFHHSAPSAPPPPPPPPAFSPP